MAKVTNKLQFTNMVKFATVVTEPTNSVEGTGLKQVIVKKNNLQNPAILKGISKDCNKPLQSASWVTSNNKGKIVWGYNSDRHYGVYRAVGDLWLCRDRAVRELSDCEREQIRLYNRLKREYEREQEILRGDMVDETAITTAEKERAKVRKIAYNLNREYYDRIYKAV